MLIVLGIIIIFIILILVGLQLCKTDKNGVYSFCKLKSCNGGYTLVGNSCKQNTDCKGSDEHGIYTKDSTGKCVLSDCVNGWGFNNNSCIQDGTPCTGGTYSRGICKKPDISTTCEEIDPGVCGTNCTLPYPIVESDKYGQYTYTQSTTPTPNFLKYTTIQGDDKMYCKLESCNTYSTKNLWWCDTNDCESSVYGSFDPTSHVPDANAYWTYIYTHDNPPGKYCAFQKCKDGYTLNGSICAVTCKDANPLPYTTPGGTITPAQNTVYKNDTYNNQNACVFDSCTYPYVQHGTDPYCVPPDYGLEGCTGTSADGDTHIVDNSIFTNDYKADGTKVCKFEKCKPNYTGVNCDIAPFCTPGNTQSCTCAYPSETACILSMYPPAKFYQTCLADGSAYDECKFDWYAYSTDTSGTDVCSKFPSC